jgi:gliding motility-associated-like protein
MPLSTKILLIYLTALLSLSEIANGQPCVLNTSPNDTVCSGTPVTLRGTPVGGTWTANAGNPATVTLVPVSSGQVSFMPAVSGNYAFTYTTATCTGAITITVNPLPPTPSFTHTAVQCGNLPYNFSAIPNLPGYTYLWNFGGGVTGTSQNPVHFFTNAIGPPGTQNFPVQLTVTNSFGCSANTTQNVSVRRVPDATMGSNDIMAPLVGDSVFKKCDRLPFYNFSFNNQSSTTATNILDSIIWGYSTPVDTTLNWGTQVLTHVYPFGLKKLVRYVTANDGCIGKKEYGVFVGASPSVTIDAPGNNKICTMDSIVFPIRLPINPNPPGTIYTVKFHDGSPSLTFVDTLPSTITHTYTRSSCNNPDFLTLPHSFYLEIVSTNPCDPVYAYYTPIYVSDKPNPSFSISPRDTVCIGTTVMLANTSSSNFINTNANPVTCQQLNASWTISPSSYTIVTGTLNSQNLQVRFNDDTVYTITMTTSGLLSCSNSSVTKTICVNPLPTRSFTLSDSMVRCTPDTVTAFGNTNQATCGNNRFSWRVDYAPYDDCLPNTRGDTLINGTTLQSQNPQFVFRKPGRYKIILETFAPGTGQVCKSDTTSKTVIVKGLPNVALIATSPFCISDSLQPKLNNKCDTAGATVLWTYTGANILSYPGSISPYLYYAAPGLYNIAVNVTNSCGPKDTSINVQVVAPAMPNAGPDTTICSGDTISIGVGPTVSGTNYLWGPAIGIVNINSLITNVTLTYNGPNADTVFKFGLTSSVSSSPGCKATDSIFITVKKSPKLLKNTPAALCSGSAVSDTLIVSGATSYIWTPLQNIVLNTGKDTAIVSPTVTTTYYVTGSFGNGCSTTDSFKVVVGAKPNLGNDTSINKCQGQSVNLNPLYNTAGLTASWTLNGIPVANIANITVPGAYQLIAKNSTGCADTAVATVNFSPKPNLGNDTTSAICSGNAFNLYTVFDTVGLNVNWFYNNSLVPNPGSVNIAGIYTAIALNNFGCADTVRVTLSISTKPNLGTDRDTTVCAGQPVNLNTFYNTTGYASITWTLNSIVVANPLAAVSSGSYQLIVKTVEGCSDTANVVIFNKPKPSLGPDQNIPICVGQSVNLNTVFNIASLLTSWSLAGNPVSRPDSVTVSGAYQLIAINNDGCRDTAIANVVVSAQPNLNPPQQTVSACTGNPVDLTTLYNTTGFNTFWSLGGNPIGNPFSVIIPGTYMLVAESNPGGSCKDTAFVTLVFNPNYNVGPDTSVYICPGQMADLTVLYNTAGFIPQWTLNGITVSTPGAVTQPGIYKLKVTNNFGCSDSAIVTVVQKPKPNLGNDTMVMACQGIPVNLNALYNTFGLSATWTLFGSIVTNPSGILLPGTYILAVTNNQTGCSDTAIANIIFNNKPNLGPDKVFTNCIGDTVNVSNTFATAGYLTFWTPIVPTTVTSVGVFTCTAIDLFSGCSDTANASVLFRPKPELGNNVFIDACVGTYINLPSYFPNPLAANQVWTNNGVVVVRPDSVLATPNTIYQVVANNGGCYDTAFLTIGKVNPKPSISLIPAKRCYPDSLLDLQTLYTGNFASIQWSTSTGAIIGQPYIVSQSGVYKIVVRNVFGCSDSATVNYMLHPKINAFAGNDTNVVKGAAFQLNGSGGNVYLWSPGIPLIDNPRVPNPTARLFSNTLFYLEVRDTANLNCLGKDTVFIKVFDYADIFVPNAFTPGVDPNRIFIPVYVGIRELKLFRIYNRWGMMLFETKDMAKGWDGTYKGQPQELGNYVWVLQAVDNKNQPVYKKGNVALLR